MWRAGSAEEFFVDVKDAANRLFPHRRQKDMQRVAYGEMIATLEEGHVILVADFQERYTHHTQDEVQSQHWNQDSTTLFPCPVFFRMDGEVWVYSFVLLSDDGLQDNAWVQHAFSRLLQTEIPSMLQRVGAARMTRATFFTDNCGKQFKCATSFGFIGDCGIHVVEEPNRRLYVEAHYFGACHGKSLSDSEGGVVKTLARSLVVSGRVRILGSHDLYEKLVPHLNFELRKASTTEMEEYAGKIGTGQLLMASVAQDLVSTQPTLLSCGVFVQHAAVKCVVHQGVSHQQDSLSFARDRLSDIFFS